MIQPTTGPLYQPPEGRAIPGPPWGGQPAWEPATPGRVAVWCALALVAVRFSFVNDLITVLLGVNLRLLYIVTVPALVGFFFSGGLRTGISKPRGNLLDRVFPVGRPGHSV